MRSYDNHFMVVFAAVAAIGFVAGSFLTSLIAWVVL